MEANVVLVRSFARAHEDRVALMKPIRFSRSRTPATVANEGRGRVVRVLSVRVEGIAPTRDRSHQGYSLARLL